MAEPDHIFIHRAAENNLKSVSVRLPKNRLTVVTGVSGSGKSSLIFDVLYREAETRFIGSFSSRARQFLVKMKRPEVEKIEGLSPAIAVGQESLYRNPRSTVGTLTGMYDYLRLLYARSGVPENADLQPEITRSLFSFNSPEGACPVCKGLGVEDHLDLSLLVADENKTLKEGALAITTPDGYIIYSQVTMDVLDQVCRAEGFHVGIPWKDLTPEQQHIVLYGSDKIRIPYGKHPLESRMRWSGITAKPREMGIYKGILPVMEAILRRDRNKNILRFVRSGECPACKGKRLNEKALSVKIDGNSIADIASLQLDELPFRLGEIRFQESAKPVAGPVITKISGQAAILSELGLGYLSLDRESTTLSPGEARRLQLGCQAGNGLSGVLYLFDEPSVGLHPRDSQQLIRVLESIRDEGNTVIVVEHDEEFIHHADWLVDIGPAAGKDGGEILFSTSPESLNELPDEVIRKSRTFAFLTGSEKFELPARRRTGSDVLEIDGASANNLKDIRVTFRLETFNVVTGVAGAGKSTLTQEILVRFLRKKLHGSRESPGMHRSVTGWEKISKVVSIDQSPIGRTPRSNPATYTGLSDHIRDLFAAQPEAIEKGFGKSRFSFNTEGGRCETCQGAGFQEAGMHFMENVEIPCESCEGKRFNGEILTIPFRSRNISEIYEMPVEEALSFFEGYPKILRYLKALGDLGLGYLTLGQRSSTLSGGEAQRIKLASELARPQSAHTLYVLDEPTTGMHNADIKNLLRALNTLVDQGHTVILTEHHPGIVAAADHIVDLGPESGRNGGYLVASGTPEEIMKEERSHTGRALKQYLRRHPESSSRIPHAVSGIPHTFDSICFTGVTTNNLRSVDISIPRNRITVLTGVSGSGKSSLAFDTLFAEAYNRFMESFSTYVRAQLGVKDKADFEEMSGLTPALAVDQHLPGASPRSTVGTMTGVYDFYRLLYSKNAHTQSGEKSGLSSLFSFNHRHGACPACDGLGALTVCDPDKLISNPERSLLLGAMDGTKTGKFYGDPFGQYVSTLRAVGEKFGINYSVAWNRLDELGKQLALLGTGQDIHEVTWDYKRAERSGKHHFKGRWDGFIALVNEEYKRKHADHRGLEMIPVMKTETCPSCMGSRLCSEALGYRLGGLTIAELSELPVSEVLVFFAGLGSLIADPLEIASAGPLIAEILHRLETISLLGLSYLPISRASSGLSGGEAHRIRLASQIGSGLTGITYILDEPTVGLHPADTHRLMRMIRKLKDAGNTVIAVEHDPEVILSADHVIDIGPGAGMNGGRILFSGHPEQMLTDEGSVTGRYLREPISGSASRNRLLREGIQIRNARVHNLKGFDLSVPAGGIVAVTGVSGSGKSSLVFDLIYASWNRQHPAGCEAISGFGQFSRIQAIQQQSFFTSSSGTPVTYTGIFDLIRDLFAKTTEARKKGLKKSSFSFHDKNGRCDRCRGTGQVRIGMDFLSDVNIPCENCRGKRYRDAILECRYRGKDIASVLDMTVSEASAFFEDNRKITGRLAILDKVGLGYLRLGQSLDTLSGGEAQRLVLAAELILPEKEETLYLFEEPSTGLHFQDIRHLMTLFHELADKGNSLLIVEHDPLVIREADWIIDLGPEGGDNGGFVVAQGRLEEILLAKNSLTGEHLRELFRK